MNYEQSAKAQTERLMADGHATILAIESSCDETAAAIVRDGRQVISSVISSRRARTWRASIPWWTRRSKRRA